jgi:hypothetical protein
MGEDFHAENIGKPMVSLGKWSDHGAFSTPIVGV